MKSEQCYSQREYGPSLPMRGEWIEISPKRPVAAGGLSLPMRGEWIEISADSAAPAALFVSPHAGRVD